MFDKLKKLLEGGVAQVNPWDNGKTFQSVVNNRTPQQQNAVQQQQQQARVFNPARPQQAPQQNFTDKLRDILDANSQADKYRRAQMGQATSYQEQQAKAPNVYNQVAGAAEKFSRYHPLLNPMAGLNLANDASNAKLPGIGVSTQDVARQIPTATKDVGMAIGEGGYDFIKGASKGTQKFLNTAQLPFAKAKIESDYRAGKLTRQQMLDRYKAEYDQAGIKPIVVQGPNGFRISSEIEEGTATPWEFAKQIGTVGTEAGLEIAPMVSGAEFAPTKAGLQATAQQLIAKGVNPTAGAVRAAVARKIATEGAKETALFGTANAGKVIMQKGGDVTIGDIANEYKNAAVNELMGIGLGNIVSMRGWGGKRIGEQVANATARLRPPGPRIANNAPRTRVTPDGTILPPRPASEIAAELAASKARAADPNVQAKMASIKAAGQPSTPVKKINMTPDDQRILADFNDIANGVYKPDAKLQRKIELDATYIAEKYNIPLRSTPQEMAEEFDNVLQRGVTKPEFAPKPQQYNQLAPKPSKQDPLEALKVEAPDFVNTKSPNHQIYYNGKVVDMGYAGTPKEQFKYAGMRIKDNGATGYIKTPKGEYYYIGDGNKATPILSAQQPGLGGTLRPDKAPAPTTAKNAAIPAQMTSERAAEVQSKVDEMKAYMEANKNREPYSGGAKAADPLEALKAEARKYKSAEEFVKARGEPLYHGTKSDFIQFDNAKMGSQTDSGMYGKGFYLTPNQKSAKHYAGDKGYIKEVYADMKNPYVINTQADIPDIKVPNKTLEDVRNGTENYSRAFTKYLKDRGYDGVIDNLGVADNQRVVFDASQLKTRQQLTDLYNQAHSQPTPKVEATQPTVAPKSYTEPKTAFEQNTGVTAPTRRKGTLNTDRLDLTDAQKADLASRQDPILETMSHKEVQDIAKSVGIDTRSHTIDQTKEIIAKQLNTRREVVALEKQAADLSSKGGDPVKLGNLYARIDELGRASTEQGTDLARQLSARRILADESKSPVQRVFGLLRKAGVNPEVYTKEAAGVNFNNPNEVIKYYRKLVPPTKGEWLDVVRYNSMLSSPLTQIVNVSSTAGNIAMAPIERTIASNLDFIHSLATGKPRKFAGGEGRAYAKGMVKSFPDAVRAFKDSIKGLDENMNLDVGTQGGHVPIAAPGQNKLVDIAEFPMKLLGAFDNFHRTLVAGGSDAALSRRMQAGIKVRNPEMVNAAEGAYRTFNQDIGEKSQGSLLQGIDEVTAAVNRLRSSKHAVIRLPAKFTLPFVRIGANLMKQGIEYSPAGFATIPGANDKTTQLAKALMGTAVFGTAAGLLGQGRLTWSEPTNADQKAAFRAAGKQPYSMKIGNNWIGFSKLPPIISFNMAMVAALDDVQKNAKINDGGVDNILTAIAKYSPEAASKYGKFLADQSYVKSVGDLLSALQGDKEKLASLASNYPQQLVPERALLGWFAKMSDGTQRKINTDAGFAAKQVESLMQQIPGLRQHTSARVNEYGEPIASQHPVLNAFSPVPVSTENPDGVLAYDTMVNRLKTKRDDKALLAKQKEDYKSGNASGLTDKQKAAVDRSIREDEVVKKLTPVQRELYKYSKEDLESLLDGPNAKNAKVALDAKNSISSSKEAKTNKEKYEQALEKFNDPDNGYSKVEKIKKTEELKRLTVQKDYDEDTTMLHGMSKEDVWGFLSTYEDGKAAADKLLALDDALTAAGVQDKNKFRDKYGNIAIKPKEKSSGKGGSKAKTVKGQAEAVSSERKLRALLANTNNKTSYRKPATQSAKVGLKKFAVKSAGITSRKGA